MKTIFWLAVFGSGISFVLFLLTILYGFIFARQDSDYRVVVLHELYGSIYFVEWRYLLISIACLIVAVTI